MQNDIIFFLLNLTIESSLFHRQHVFPDKCDLAPAAVYLFCLANPLWSNWYLWKCLEL